MEPLDAESQLQLEVIQRTVNNIVKRLYNAWGRRVSANLELAARVNEAISDVSCFLNAMARTVSPRQYTAISQRLSALEKYKVDPLPAYCLGVVLSHIKRVVDQPKTDRHVRRQHA